MVQMVRLDRKVIRVTLDFQVSWALQGILVHQEQMELQELLDHREFKGHLGKKVLLVPKAHQEFQESREKKANRAEMESQVPQENQARQESQAHQGQREPAVHLASRDTQVILACRVLGESLVPQGPLDQKDHQEKMVILDLQDHRAPEGQGAHRVILDLQDHRAPEGQGAHRVAVDYLDPQETLAIRGHQARREAKGKMAAQDFLVSWVPGGLLEKLERKELQARRQVFLTPALSHGITDGHQAWEACPGPTALSSTYVNVLFVLGGAPGKPGEPGSKGEQ
ncbi:uncharacterized protein LOC108491692, partial [Nannospalax galili]|uniref:uncharacterized protein LOC108491692 n=1 Tax=Nannospalax galili TaxID=1026970 RepID=UPI00081A0B42